jgi:hypothetical protein
MDRYQLGRGWAGPHSSGAGALAGRVVELDIHKEHVAQVDDPDQQQQQQGKHQSELHNALRPAP